MSKLHAVTMFRVQKVCMRMASCISSTSNISTNKTNPKIICWLTVHTNLNIWNQELFSPGLTKILLRPPLYRTTPHLHYMYSLTLSVADLVVGNLRSLNISANRTGWIFPLSETGWVKFVVTQDCHHSRYAFIHPLQTNCTIWKLCARARTWVITFLQIIR